MSAADGWTGEILVDAETGTTYLLLSDGKTTVIVAVEVVRE